MSTAQGKVSMCKAPSSITSTPLPPKRPFKIKSKNPTKISAKRSLIIKYVVWVNTKNLPRYSLSIKSQQSNTGKLYLFLPVDIFLNTYRRQKRSTEPDVHSLPFSASFPLDIRSTFKESIQWLLPLINHMTLQLLMIQHSTWSQTSLSINTQLTP